MRAMVDTLSAALPADPSVWAIPAGGLPADQEAQLTLLWARLADSGVIDQVRSVVHCLATAPPVPGADTDPEQRRQARAGLDWLSEPDAFVPEKFVNTPTQLTPPEGSVFGTFPRTTTLEWATVTDAVSYRVQVQYCEQLDCSGTPVTWIDTTVGEPTFTFDFVGEQPGRWRVASTDAGGVESAFSPWRTFVYTV